MSRSVSNKTKSKQKSDTVRNAAKKAGERSQPKKSAAAKARQTATAEKAKAGRSKRRELIIDEFRSVVNISRGHFERWLATPESRKLRFPDEPKNRTIPGQAILKLLTKKKEKFTPEDVDKMDSVIEFIEGRIRKRPKGDIVASNWRYSLMNWGHDPTKPLKRVRGKQNER